MTAATADQVSTVRSLQNATYEVKAIKTAITLYVGTLVSFSTIGRLVDGAAVASTTFAGELVAILNDSGAIITAGTGNTAGTVLGLFRYGHEMRLGVKTSSRTYSNLGKSALIADNVNVGGTSVGTAGVRVVAGTLTEFAVTGAAPASAWVRLRTMGTAAMTA
jgi:hypothetical protein